MRHNKFIGWERFLETLERVEQFSPWLSRQISKRASEWPYWFSGAKIKLWNDQQVWVQMANSVRNMVNGEVTPGHLHLVAELTLRLLLLRYRSEFPFHYRILEARVQTHHTVDQAVDFRFAISMAEWELIRRELAQTSRATAELVFSATLSDGRLAATFTFHVAFELEKSLPA